MDSSIPTPLPLALRVRTPFSVLNNTIPNAPRKSWTGQDRFQHDFSPVKRRRTRSLSDRELLQANNTLRPRIAAHMFSNTSSQVHVLLPILLAVSNLATRVRLRNTCKLFKRICDFTKLLSYSMDDITINAAKLNAVYVRDWETDAGIPTRLAQTSLPPRVKSPSPQQPSSFTGHNDSLRAFFRPASCLELSLVIHPYQHLIIYVYTRLPCMETSAWDERVHGRPHHSTEDLQLERLICLPHFLFGTVRREEWFTPSKAGFTVRDLGVICAGRWLGIDASGSNGGHDLPLIPLVTKPGFEGFIMDSVQMQNYEYQAS